MVGGGVVEKQHMWTADTSVTVREKSLAPRRATTNAWVVALFASLQELVQPDDGKPGLGNCGDGCRGRRQTPEVGRDIPQTRITQSHDHLQQVSVITQEVKADCLASA